MGRVRIPPKILGKPVIIARDLRTGTYIVERGGEAYYDETGDRIEHEGIFDARKWSLANLGVDPPFETQVKSKSDGRQLSLGLTPVPERTGFFCPKCGTVSVDGLMKCLGCHEITEEDLDGI
jgi:predicted RNA-binding Zn-ribbon protein involved in translation (DUF1610 family)